MENKNNVFLRKSASAEFSKIRNENKMLSSKEDILGRLSLQQNINSLEVEGIIKAIIVEKLGVEESEVTREASFTNDLEADSLDAVELIMEFEKAFGVEIPEVTAERILTVGDAIKAIENIKLG